MKVFIRTNQETQAHVAMSMAKTGGADYKPDVDEHVVIADMNEDEIAHARSGGFEVLHDIVFKPMDLWWEREEAKVGPATAAPPWASKTMSDVMAHIRAPQAWTTSSGSGVTIAVVDTGIDLTTNQFPNLSPHHIAPSFVTPTDDPLGHGSMCAAVALGSDERGGRYRGVAPSATLLAARSSLMATDLYVIYQHLLREKRRGSFPGGLVVSNSYGLYQCGPSGHPNDHPYLDLVRLCIAEGIVFVFAAGNNHAEGVCKHPAGDCSPNTIWSVNSIDEVITVGTVNWDETNRAPGEHANSSRGPGEWSAAGQKPDVVAPTYGEVVWGGGYRRMEWWGTSGACPQVAGLAALLLSKDPSLTPSQVAEIIRSSARSISGAPTCVGTGIIDCESALATL